MTIDTVMLSTEERAFYDDLERMMPTLFQSANVRHDPDTGAALIELMPPGGDTSLAMRFWVDGEESERCLAFGPWETYESMLLADTQLGNPGESFIAIVNDEIVLVEDLDEDYRDYETALDLRHANALRDHFDSPYCSSRIKLHSWSGAANQELNRDSLSAVAA